MIAHFGEMACSQKPNPVWGLRTFLLLSVRRPGPSANGDDKTISVYI